MGAVELVISKHKYKLFRNQIIFLVLFYSCERKINMAIIIGSARSDEFGKITGGVAGDQKQKSSTNDTIGEVSMQNFYVHSKGWYILRPKCAEIANKIATNMKIACNNPNIGYDQGNRFGIITYGVNTKTKTECDCSSLVRQCVKEASGIDPGNFSTANEVSVLQATNLFETKKSYTNGTDLYTGDVLVTKTKGHTVIVVDGLARTDTPTICVTPSIQSEKYIYQDIDYSLVFDPTYYSNTYADLKKALGTNTAKLFNHFCIFGMKEGRIASASFNVNKYKSYYADLRSAFGNNLPLYYEHYIKFGYKEKRKCV